MLRNSNINLSFTEKVLEIQRIGVQQDEIILIVITLSYLFITSDFAVMDFLFFGVFF